MSKISTMLIATAAAALMTGAAAAHAPRDPDAVGNIAKMAAGANLAFHGKVVQVDYQAPFGKGPTAIPHTFVTYRVDSVMRGKASSKTLTLRFAGGVDGKGGFVDVEGVPTFQVGDEDILFVAGNGDQGCPLVQCEFGRYRVYNNAVYEAHGSPVLAVKGGRILADGKAPDVFSKFSYPAPTFDQLYKRADVKAAIKQAGLTVAEARARFEAKAPKTISTMAVDPLELPKNSGLGSESVELPGMTVDQFMSNVGAGLAAVAAPQAVVQSADMRSVQATATAIVPVAPPVVPMNSMTLDKPEAPITKN